MMACLQIAQAASTKEEKMKLLDKLDKLDMLDKLDQLDFQDAIDSANNCTRQRNFKCSLQNIDKASNLAETDKQEDIIAYAKQEYENEKQQYEYEKELRRIEEKFEREERRQKRIAQEKQEKYEKERKRQARLEKKRRRDAEHAAASAQWAENLDRKLSNWSADMQRSNEQFNKSLNRNINSARNFQQEQEEANRRAEQERRDALNKAKEQHELRRQAYEQSRREKDAERQRKERELNKQRALADALKDKERATQNMAPKSYAKDCSLIRASISANFGYQKKQAACYFDEDGRDRPKADIRACQLALDKSYASFARSVYRSEGRLDCQEKKTHNGISNTFEQ